MDELLRALDAYDTEHERFFEARIDLRSARETFVRQVLDNLGLDWDYDDPVFIRVNNRVFEMCKEHGTWKVSEIPIDGGWDFTN